MTDNRVARWCAPVMAVAGVLLVLGGQVHPRGPLDEDFDALEAHLLSDAGTWQATHGVLAAAVVALTAGLVLLWRSPQARADRVLRGWTGVAVAGAVISLVELGFHIAMTTESDALAAGGPTRCSTPTSCWRRCSPGSSGSPSAAACAAPGADR